MLQLLTGLEERGTRAGHDIRLTEVGGSDLAYLTCKRCGLDVTVIVVNDLGGWRIRPHVASLDLECSNE